MQDLGSINILDNPLFFRDFNNRIYYVM